MSERDERAWERMTGAGMDGVVRTSRRACGFDPSVIAVRSFIGHKYCDFSYTCNISLWTHAHAHAACWFAACLPETRGDSWVNECIKETRICVSMAMEYWSVFKIPPLWPLEQQQRQQQQQQQSLAVVRCQPASLQSRKLRLYLFHGAQLSIKLSLRAAHSRLSNTIKRNFIYLHLTINNRNSCCWRA